MRIVPPTGPDRSVPHRQESLKLMPFDPLSADAVSHHAPARAALAGNPSDGYDGRVVATVITQMSATVTVAPSDTFRVGDTTFATTDNLPPYDQTGDAALFVASIAIAARRWQVTPCTIQWTTTIPRSVGLSGSSALVIATLKALAEHDQQQLDPQQLPSMALAAEKLLGITAGLQDRVVQTFGGLQDMTFPRRPARGEAAFTQRLLSPRRELELAVLYDTSAAEPSQVFHGELRQRYDDGDQSVRTAMRSLARAAETASRAVEAGDLRALGVAMNESYDLRAGMSDLSPSHVRLIELVRSCGLAANYAGSGGSVVALITSTAGRDRLAALADQQKLGLHRWTVPPSRPASFG